MVDIRPKIWYNARRKGKDSLAPFCFFENPGVLHWKKFPDAYYAAKKFRGIYARMLSDVKKFGAI